MTDKLNPTPEMQRTVQIHLSEAVFCEGCQNITNAQNGHCPVCAGSGQALVRVDTYIPQRDKTP